MRNKLINIDPEIMSGTPVFNGTRVPVQSLFDWLENETLDKFSITILNTNDNKINTLIPFIEELERHLINSKRGVIEIDASQSAST